MHALDCKKGGLVIPQHSEARDALGDIAALGYKEVVREPVDEAKGISALVTDLGVRGVWEPQAEALFDICGVDTDAQSYTHCTVSAVLTAAAKEKKRKYAQAALARHASFSSFVLSMDGLMVHEAQFVVMRFASKLSTKWRKSYGEGMGWAQTRLSFAILRATNRCVRGSRMK